MKILYVLPILFVVAFASFLWRRNRSKTCKIPSSANVQKFIFGAEHKAILHQFNADKDDQLSADDLGGLTNIEPVKVHAVLSDLVDHDLLVQTNTDKVEVIGCTNSQEMGENTDRSTRNRPYRTGSPSRPLPRQGFGASASNITQAGQRDDTLDELDERPLLCSTDEALRKTGPPPDLPGSTSLHPGYGCVLNPINLINLTNPTKLQGACP